MPTLLSAWRQVQAVADRGLVATLGKALVLTVSINAIRREAGLTKVLKVKIVNGGMESDKR